MKFYNKNQKVKYNKYTKMEYETMSPPQAQERESTNGSANLSPK